MTGDKIIPFSFRDCQHHAKGATGAATPAGINDGVRVGRAGDQEVENPDPALRSDQAAEATSHAESWGHGALHKLGAQNIFAK